MIQLKYCAIEWVDEGVRTSFLDAATTAFPYMDDPRYLVASRRAGYGDDMMTYCREHDFLHAFLSEELADKPSNVLWASAHDTKLLPFVAYQEEALVQVFQCWLRGSRDCLIGEMPYYPLRGKAREILKGM